MYRIRKSFTFEAAHQLDQAESAACVGSIHGHSYKVELFLSSLCLNGDGMVIDFKVLESFIRRVKDQWDHALFLSAKRSQDFQGVSRLKIVNLAHPTAEVMARELFDFFNHFYGCSFGPSSASTGIRLEKVRVHETGTGWAEYEE